MVNTKTEMSSFDEIFTTGCTESCQMTTFSAAHDENFNETTTFPF